MKTRFAFILILLLFSMTAFAQKITIDSTSVPGVKIKYLDGEKVYVRADTLPEYPGGSEKMPYFIRDNLRYPLMARESGVVGRVFTQVIVSKTGNIVEYSINKSVHPLLDQEALRVVKKMPKKGWTPGKVKGEPVNMYCIIPITFRMRVGVQDNKEVYLKEMNSLPSYPGGETAMHTFIQQKLEYPKEAQKKEIEGRVYLQFVVTETGEISDIEVSRSVHPLLDSEAIRVVKMMPKWIPAMENGEPVKAVFKLPMQFRLR
ncbi:TonB family protein [Dysgonomonas reticulitermitis]